MEEETIKPVKRKKRGDEATSWDRLVRTKSGKQVIFYIRIDEQLAKRMKIAGDWLKQKESENEGTGIKHNFPARYCIFCLEAATDGLEKAMKAEKENL